jgi:hypothetical protein
LAAGALVPRQNSAVANGPERDVGDGEGGRAAEGEVPG